MISFELGVEDLADTRFALSPLHETVYSLRVLRDPGLHALHLPWRASVLARLDPRDAGPLAALVGRRLALPDFLTPRPTAFATSLREAMSLVRGTPPRIVRRDLEGALIEGPIPAGDASAARFRDDTCDLLRRYWELAVEPVWPRMRLLLEADMTYRARQLAVGGARLLFADMHPNLRWHEGVLHIDKMIGRHRVAASGRGLLLMPSVFAHKPAPPVSPEEPPLLTYPGRAVATLWSPAPAPDATALTSLLGAPRAALLGLLAEPLPTVELARRLGVTPSAVSQHLRVLYATGLVTRARDGRHVLYRRSPLGEELATPPHRPAAP
ncbi:helix-turn-helix domain-containing protein [Streptosporangium sp. DT93]|uniref:ArsR/SmtB family transcription factor n=1 Tax=Streptosporangium sp. DT93 TaxID=3393428 RepID=UPI003CF933D5